MSSAENKASAASLTANLPKGSSSGSFEKAADRALSDKPASGATSDAAGLVKFAFDRTTIVGHPDEILDVGVGKDGVLSRREASDVELRIMSAMYTADGASLAQVEDSTIKQSFLIALRVYLAMHSSENADDGRGALEDGVMLSFGASSVDGATVKAAARMSSFHRYLRARADEVRDSIKFILARASQPEADRNYPLACETARNIRVNAVNRFMPDYPQYAFVGADFCSTVTPRVREVIAASKAALLLAQRGPDIRAGHKFREVPKPEGAVPGLPDF